MTMNLLRKLAFQEIPIYPALHNRIIHIHRPDEYNYHSCGEYKQSFRSASESPDQDLPNLRKVQYNHRK